MENGNARTVVIGGGDARFGAIKTGSFAHGAGDFARGAEG